MSDETVSLLRLRASAEDREGFAHGGRQLSLRRVPALLAVVDGGDRVRAFRRKAAGVFIHLRIAAFPIILILILILLVLIVILVIVVINSIINRETDPSSYSGESAAK